MQDLQSVTIFRPTLGLVSQVSTLRRRIMVLILASPYQSVVAVLDGTVMLGSFTAESGYTICILHSGELVSVTNIVNRCSKSVTESVRVKW